MHLVTLNSLINVSHFLTFILPIWLTNLEFNHSDIKSSLQLPTCLVYGHLLTCRQYFVLLIFYRLFSHFWERSKSNLQQEPKKSSVGLLSITLLTPSGNEVYYNTFISVICGGFFSKATGNRDISPQYWLKIRKSNGPISLSINGSRRIDGNKYN